MASPQSPIKQLEVLNQSLYKRRCTMDEVWNHPHGFPGGLLMTQYMRMYADLIKQQSSMSSLEQQELLRLTLQALNTQHPCHEALDIFQELLTHFSVNPWNVPHLAEDIIRVGFYQKHTPLLQWMFEHPQKPPHWIDLPARRHSFVHFLMEKGLEHSSLWFSSVDWPKCTIEQRKNFLKSMSKTQDLPLIKMILTEPSFESDVVEMLSQSSSFLSMLQPCLDALHHGQKTQHPSSKKTQAPKPSHDVNTHWKKIFSTLFKQHMDQSPHKGEYVSWFFKHQHELNLGSGDVLGTYIKQQQQSNIGLSLHQPFLTWMMSNTWGAQEPEGWRESVNGIPFGVLVFTALLNRPDFLNDFMQHVIKKQKLKGKRWDFKSPMTAGHRHALALFFDIPQFSDHLLSAIDDMSIPAQGHALSLLVTSPLFDEPVLGHIQTELQARHAEWIRVLMEEPKEFKVKGVTPHQMKCIYDHSLIQQSVAQAWIYQCREQPEQLTDKRVTTILQTLASKDLGKKETSLELLQALFTHVPQSLVQAENSTWRGAWEALQVAWKRQKTKTPWLEQAKLMLLKHETFVDSESSDEVQARRMSRRL